MLKGLSANLSSSCSCSHPVSLSPATELAKGKQNGWFKKKKKKKVSKWILRPVHNYLV